MLVLSPMTAITMKTNPNYPKHPNPHAFQQAGQYRRQSERISGPFGSVRVVRVVRVDFGAHMPYARFVNIEMNKKTGGVYERE
jgi:hypothetical protein